MFAFLAICRACLMFLLCPSVAFCSFFNWYSLFDYRLIFVQVFLPKNCFATQVYYKSGLLSYSNRIGFSNVLSVFIYVFVSK